MNERNTITVHIMDKEYCIVCPPEERPNLESAARHLDNRMREIRSHGKVIGAERVAVMAALNITYELLNSSNNSRTPAPKNRDQVKRLLDRADTALTDEVNTPEN